MINASFLWIEWAMKNKGRGNIPGQSHWLGAFLPFPWDTLVPGGETLVPFREALVPVPEILVPARESLVPVGETLVPGGETLVQVRETLVPGGETLVSGWETLVPGRETLVPGRETLVPGRETLDPDQKTPVRARDTQTPFNFYSFQPTIILACLFVWPTLKLRFDCVMSPRQTCQTIPPLSSVVWCYLDH